MAMDYDTRLIDGADIVGYTGVQDLANLAADAELALDTITLEGHRFVYRWLEQTGIDPTKLTNQARLNSAVAYATLLRLAISGTINPLGDIEQSVNLFRDQLMTELQAYKPATSEADVSRNADEGIPSVGNFEAGWVYGPTGSTKPAQKYWDDFQGSQ